VEVEAVAQSTQTVLAVLLALEITHLSLVVSEHTLEHLTVVVVVVWLAQVLQAQPTELEVLVLQVLLLGVL
jgi:hypothetical protein